MDKFNEHHDNSKKTMDNDSANVPEANLDLSNDKTERNSIINENEFGERNSNDNEFG